MLCQLANTILMANDVPEIMGRVNENENRSKISLAQKAVKKPTNYLTGFQQVEILKCLLVTVPGVHILECLETNMVLNGWWNLTQIITGKFNRRKKGPLAMHHPPGDGNATIHEIATNCRKSLDNSVLIPATLAPNTLRMPISFVLRSAVKAAKPNKPKQEIIIANMAKTL